MSLKTPSCSQRAKLTLIPFCRTKGSSSRMIWCYAGRMTGQRIVFSLLLQMADFFVRYITRRDGSPLMDALELWRQAALKGGPQVSSRPVSPMEDEDRRLRTTSMDTEDNLSNMEQQANGQADQTAKPTSSSWVRWWSRSRRADTIRPELRPASSEPPDVVRLDCGCYG